MHVPSSMLSRLSCPSVLQLLDHTWCMSHPTCSTVFTASVCCSCWITTPGACPIPHAEQSLLPYCVAVVLSHLVNVPNCLRVLLLLDHIWCMSHPSCSTVFTASVCCSRWITPGACPIPLTEQSLLIQCVADIGSHLVYVPSHMLSSLYCLDQQCVEAVLSHLVHVPSSMLNSLNCLNVLQSLDHTWCIAVFTASISNALKLFDHTRCMSDPPC